MIRTARLVALAGLVVSPLVVLPGGPAAADPSDWCTASPAPCIVSVERDGVPVLASDTTWQVDLVRRAHKVRWDLAESGSHELTSAATGTWEVTVDMGTTVPRVSHGTGRNGEVTRVQHLDGTWTVTTSAEPTLVATGCDSSSVPWDCPGTASDQALRLGGQLLDWHFWEDDAQRRAFLGVDFWTNAEVTSFPADVVHDDATGTAAMRLALAAPHFETDGVTEHLGHVEAVLPNDFLRENLHIPDPGTMTPASLVVAGGGPDSTTTLTKASPASPVEIEVTDMTFSTRRLRVQTGTVVPTRPGNVRATRTSTRAGRLDYDLATPRGARVTGYRARCVPASGPTVTATRHENASPLPVTGLTSGRTYWCRVRALSRAGAGPWSASDRMTS